MVTACPHDSGVTWRTSTLQLCAGSRSLNEVSFCCVPQSQRTFPEHPSANSDLLYHICWGRCLALVLCISRSFVLVLAFLCLPISGSPWFITCQTISIFAGCQDGAWAQNRTEQKVPHAWPASTGQTEL